MGWMVPGSIFGRDMRLFEIFPLVGYYAALSDKALSSDFLTLEYGTARVVSKRRYRITTQCRVISQKSADLMYIAAEA